MRRKLPKFWERGDWMIHHDNASAHSFHLVQDYLTKHGIVKVKQAPYSLDTAPCDLWLFSKLKIPLKGRRLDDVEDMKRNATGELVAIPK